MKKLAILISLVVLLNSCASILNTRYQKVDIKHEEDSEITINGDSPDKSEGKYVLKKDGNPKEIVISKEGKKDKHITIMQYERPAIYYMSWVPFIVTLAPLFDYYDKAFNFADIIETGKLTDLPKRSDSSKYIYLKNVKVDLEASDIKVRSFDTYRDYIKWGYKLSPENIDEAEDINIENTTFSNTLNEVLKENGYIDTSNRVLKNSYLNNLAVEATLNSYTFHVIKKRKETYQTRGFIYVDIGMEWEIFDFYDNSILTLDIESTSGQIRFLELTMTDNSELESSLEIAMKDALEYNLIKFLNEDSVTKLMNDKNRLIEEESYEEISLINSGDYVESLSDAIKSAVTLRNDKGHGSGFIISDSGHIITNYHVVSKLQEDGGEVVLNDGSKFDFEVIRTSKIHDLALVKIDTFGFKAFKILPTEEIEIAATVYALGTPSSEDLNQTISKGIISGIRNTGENSKLIQTDASINSGNSGGALLTPKGEVVGVVSSKLKGFGVEGVAFGIPAYQILKALKIRFE